jgi:threonine dehydrogenase-like Zn-dependent dehydrogenase
MDTREGVQVLTLLTVRPGLVTLLSAKAFGADEVAVVDPMVSRLEVAKTLGADAVFSFGGKAKGVQAGLKPMDDEEGSSADARVLKEWSQGKGPDVIIDCAGFEGTIKVT